MRGAVQDGSPLFGHVREKYLRAEDTMLHKSSWCTNSRGILKIYIDFFTNRSCYIN